jgi:signal transduction histidine kinase
MRGDPASTPNGDRMPGQPLTAVIGRLAACAGPAALDNAIRECLALMGRYVGVDRACLIAFSDDHQTFTMTHEWHGDGIHSQLEYFVNLPISTFPWTAHQLLAGAPVPIDRLDDYPPEAEMERQICLVEKNLSIIFVPTVVRGRVVGAVAMDGIRAPHAWTDADIALMQASGTYMATLLDAHKTDERMESISRLEREKLGRDLHDSLGQQLVAISLLAASLQHGLTRNKRLAADASRIAELTAGVVQTARDMTQGLKPFDIKGEGLPAALRRMAEETSSMLGVKCRFVNEDAPPVQDPEACTQLFWIAREATNNAIRHGKATRVTLTMSLQDGKQRLTVSDNGKGLPSDWESKDGVGLKVMRFRAAVMGGQVSIQPGPKVGTLVTCVFPAARGF